MSTEITYLRGSKLRPIHRGSVLLSKQDVEPAVNRQPGFRQKLVEQITLFRMPSQSFLLVDVIKY